MVRERINSVVSNDSPRTPFRTARAGRPVRDAGPESEAVGVKCALPTRSRESNYISLTSGATLGRNITSSPIHLSRSDLSIKIFLNKNHSIEREARGGPRGQAAGGHNSEMNAEKSPGVRGSRKQYQTFFIALFLVRMFYYYFLYHWKRRQFFTPRRGRPSSRASLTPKVI